MDNNSSGFKNQIHLLDGLNMNLIKKERNSYMYGRGKKKN